MNALLAQARTEAAAAQEKLAVLEKLVARFPDLKASVDRWDNLRYCTPEVNRVVDQYEARHNCGCCADSPLEIWPYIMFEGARVYASPIPFRVAEKHGTGDIPFPSWREQFSEAKINEALIEKVAAHLEIAERDALGQDEGL